MVAEEITLDGEFFLGHGVIAHFLQPHTAQLDKNWKQEGKSGSYIA